MSEGWKCPGCGSCYAPWVPKCDTCTGIKITITPAVEPCAHRWGEQGTFGATCSICGELKIGPWPHTITTTGDNHCMICGAPYGAQHMSNCGRNG